MSKYQQSFCQRTGVLSQNYSYFTILTDRSLRCFIMRITWCGSGRSGQRSSRSRPRLTTIRRLSCFGCSAGELEKSIFLTVVGDLCSETRTVRHRVRSRQFSTINVSTAHRVRAWRQLSIDLAQLLAEHCRPRRERNRTARRLSPAMRGPYLGRAIRHTTAWRAGRRAGQTVGRA